MIHCGIFPGWGRLICSSFDTLECKIEAGEQVPFVAFIPKLGKQWKVIFDLKIDEYTPPDDAVSLMLIKDTAEGDDIEMYCKVTFTSEVVRLQHIDYEGCEAWAHQIKIGEWNRIEITQEEEEDEEFFLSLSVGDVYLGRLFVGSLDSKLEHLKFTNVQPLLSVHNFPKPVFIRRFCVVEKC